MRTRGRCRPGVTRPEVDAVCGVTPPGLGAVRGAGAGLRGDLAAGWTRSAGQARGGGGGAAGDLAEGWTRSAVPARGGVVGGPRGRRAEGWTRAVGRPRDVRGDGAA